MSGHKFSDMETNPATLGQPVRAIYPRRCDDIAGSAVKYLNEACVLADRPLFQRAAMKAHVSYGKDMLPGALYGSDPRSYITSKFMHVAVNKNRCAINCVDWLPHGRRVLTATQSGEFTLWNGTQFTFENIMQAHSSAVRATAWLPDGNTLISGDAAGGMKLWDWNFFPFAQWQAHKETIRDITVAPTGAKFATCADEAQAKVWDFRTGAEERQLAGHGWDVRAVHWHPDKALIATGSKDCNIKLWDPRVSEAVSTIYAHKSVITRLRWSPDGNWLVSGSRDLLLKAMDIRKMSTVERVFKGHLKEITCLSWHPIDPSLFVSGSYDGHLCFWDVHQPGVPVESLVGAHDASIWSVSFHPLGHLLVTGSHDNCTKFWARPMPGDPPSQEMAPKGRMYQQYQEMLKEKENLSNLPMDNIYRPPLPQRTV